ncbi:hypothetical protein StrepF001_43035 [Streptomyces sp. F001]|nr:hypothetical protein StrepF001_43035 [Streptomyces sp. F001]
MPHKKPECGKLTEDQQQFNKVIGAIRAPAEKADANLKTRFKALRRVSLAPQRISGIVAAALVLFHFERGRVAQPDGTRHVPVAGSVVKADQRVWRVQPIEFDWVFPSLSSPSIEFDWVFPSLSSPSIEFFWVFPSLSLPLIRFSCSFPSLSSPLIEFSCSLKSLSSPSIEFFCLLKSLSLPLIRFFCLLKSLSLPLIRFFCSLKSLSPPCTTLTAAFGV